jgi:hypothetical protein
MKKSYEESDNVFISYTRAFTSTLGMLINHKTNLNLVY